MRNHDEKARDMARSVLPSNARKTARRARAQIHGRDRARERQLLNELRRAPDFGDLDDEAPLGRDHRLDMLDMVRDRRDADKVAPLLRWAARTVERDPRLSAASPEDREAYFRSVLPPGLIGDHAVTHLWSVIGTRWCRPTRHGTAPAEIAADIELVQDVVAAGCHGDLNRRIRAGIPVVRRTVRLPAERVIDDDHPAPGLLLPARWVTEYRRLPVRFLAGAHDIEAFVGDAPWWVRDVVRSFHAEVIGSPAPRVRALPSGSSIRR